MVCVLVCTRWTIRVRVVSKPSIRTWSNSRGEGRVLNANLVDETVTVVCAVYVCVFDSVV